MNLSLATPFPKTHPSILMSLKPTSTVAAAHHFAVPRFTNDQCGSVEFNMRLQSGVIMCHLQEKNLSFAHKIWTNIISFSCVLRFISRLRCGVQHWRSRYSRCANPAANNTKSKSVEDTETGIQTQLFRLSDEWFSRAGPGCGLISRVAKTRNI